MGEVTVKKHDVRFDSILEESCWKQLVDIFGECSVEVHPKIDGCSFDRSGKSYLDFRLVEQNLYVEVKGFMTLFAVNKMRYIHRLLAKNYYILQCTEEGWMHPFDETEKTVGEIKKIVASNVNEQLNELKELKNGRITAEELSRRSCLRLENYILHRQGDFARWNEKYGRMTGNELWGVTQGKERTELIWQVEIGK